MKEVNYNQGEKILLVCIVGNIVLSLLKLLAGILGNSKAMVADALHSTSDIVATTVVLIGIKIAQKPKDKEHPYGHGKVEPIAAAFVAFALFFAAAVIIKSTIESIITGSIITPNYIAVAAAILSISVKEAMFRVTYGAGKKIRSESIVADAWHHRSDAYSSIGTLIGIMGSIVGNQFNIRLLKYLDPLAGVVVACLILKVAFGILRNSIGGLMDASPDINTIQFIENAVISVDGIISVPMIKARYVGSYLFVDMKIGVSSKITVNEGHTLAAKAKDKLMESVTDINEVLIHVEPVNLNK